MDSNPDLATSPSHDEEAGVNNKEPLLAESAEQKVDDNSQEHKASTSKRSKDRENSVESTKSQDSNRTATSYSSPTDETGHLLPGALVMCTSLTDSTGCVAGKCNGTNGTGGGFDGTKMNGELKKNVSSSSLCSQARHRVRMEECVPSHSSLKDREQEIGWKISLDMFSPKKRGKSKQDRGLSRSIRRYYKTQDELITAFEELQLEVDDAMEGSEDALKLQKRASILAKLSFFCNLLLLIGKAVAAGLSGSLAVISSVIDSGVDLVSGALMWWSGRAVKRRNIYQYPQGRTKLEPIAIVILSVIMSLASVQMIRESVEKIILYATEDAQGPSFGITSIVICSLTIVIKFILFMVCRRTRTPGVDALTQDHRNDVLSNTVAIACGIIGARLWPYADPVGAILISVYIMASWFLTGWEQIKMLTGHTARPDFLKKITWLALNHHPEIKLIDTVRAFHFGNNFLVEVDIVLDEEMSLRRAHDIGESLQLKIERLPEVERAFVHLDYETEHSPFSEHKQV